MKSADLAAASNFSGPPIIWHVYRLVPVSETVPYLICDLRVQKISFKKLMTLP